MRVSIRSARLSCVYSLCVACLVVALVGCGPTFKTKLAPGAVLPSHVAVLPADYAIDIPRERIDLVRAALISELRNRNYIVAEDAAVKKICSTPVCAEREKLASQYLVGGFVSLSIDSFSKNSFLAGYYNQLSGKLSVTDAKGKELCALEHTQSERGGLLFNSGQVIQGIISQVQNTGDGAYRDLAAKFAQTLVEQLPTAQVAADSGASEPADLALTSVSAQWSSPTSYTVCAQGTPKSFGTLLVGSQKINLREVAPGRYCTALSSLVAVPESSSAYVELRTAYGNSLRERVVLPATIPCGLENRLQISDHTATLKCLKVAQDGSRREEGCSEKAPPCSVEKVILFGSKSEGGLYQKISESRTASFVVPQGDLDYEAVALGAGGVPSLPARISSLSK